MSNNRDLHRSNLHRLHVLDGQPLESFPGSQNLSRRIHLDCQIRHLPQSPVY